MTTQNKKKVRTWFNPIPSPSEKTDPVSKTQPDQTMSMRTILERYAQGLPLGGSNADGAYDQSEEDEFPDPRTLDLVDKQALWAKNKADIAALKNQARDEVQKAREAAIQAEIAKQKAEAEKPPAEDKKH